MTVATNRRDTPSVRAGSYLATLMAELDIAQISLRIREARVTAGFRNREDAADVMQVHRNTFAAWENPKDDNVPFTRIDELARVLGTTKWWLLHGDEVAPVQEIDSRLQELEETTARGLESLERAIDALTARLPQQGDAGAGG